MLRIGRVRSKSLFILQKDHRFSCARATVLVQMKLLRKGQGLVLETRAASRRRSNCWPHRFPIRMRPRNFNAEGPSDRGPRGIMRAEKTEAPPNRSAVSPTAPQNPVPKTLHQSSFQLSQPNQPILLPTPSTVLQSPTYSRSHGFLKRGRWREDGRRESRVPTQGHGSL